MRSYLSSNASTLCWIRRLISTGTNSSLLITARPIDARQLARGDELRRRAYALAAEGALERLVGERVADEGRLDAVGVAVGENHRSSRCRQSSRPRQQIRSRRGAGRRWPVHTRRALRERSGANTAPAHRSARRTDRRMRRVRRHPRRRPHRGRSAVRRSCRAPSARRRHHGRDRRRGHPGSPRRWCTAGGRTRPTRRRARPPRKRPAVGRGRLSANPPKFAAVEAQRGARPFVRSARFDADTDRARKASAGVRLLIAARHAHAVRRATSEQHLRVRQEAERRGRAVAVVVAVAAQRGPGPMHPPRRPGRCRRRSARDRRRNAACPHNRRGRCRRRPSRGCRSGRQW